MTDLEELVERIRSRSLDRLPPRDQWAELRRRAGLSQNELADAVGVTSGTLSRWEQGICSPRGAHIAEYAEVLDVIRRELANDG